MSLRLFLLRHGETDWNRERRHQGRTDTPLSEIGRTQAEAAARELKEHPIKAVYASPLRRARDTAAVIAASHGLEVETDEAFQELHFGRWEGLTREEIAARDPQLFQQWRATLHEFTYPGGDTVAAFRARVVATVRDWLPTAPARPLLIVHKGIIASIVTELRRLSLAERAAYPIDLASIHTLVESGGQWHAEQVNAIAHLDDLQ